jgi:hypothetical protein
MGWPHVKVGLEMGGKAQERLEEPVENPQNFKGSIESL